MAVVKININKEKLKKYDTKKYVNKKLNYPDSSVNPDKKGAEYHKQWGEKIYTLFLNRQSWLTSSEYTQIDALRAWSDGKQDVSEILDWLIGKKEKPKDLGTIDADGFDLGGSGNVEKKRKAWSNIDATPVSVFPKIKSKIQEQIRSMYYEMSVNAIDSFSAKEEEHEKYRLWFYKQNKKWLDTQKELAGIKVEEEQQFMPENLEELELYAATGGFKMPYSISMEDLIRHTFDISSWDKDVAEKIRADLINLGYAIIREEFDRELKRVVVKYSDPKYSGVQYGKNGYKDTEFGYELEWVEISKVRQRLNLNYQDAAALAFSFSDMYGNPGVEKFDSYNNIHTNDNGAEWLGFDFYKVPVFTYEFIDIDNEQYVAFTDRFGDSRTKPYRGELQDNEELRQDQDRYVRQGKWIVGTQHIYDYGIKEYIPRDSFSRPRTSYRAIRMNTTPILQQVLPYIKGLQLAWMKLQQAIALAVGNGFAVDIGSIKNIAIGKGNNWDPLEVLDYYRQSTFLMFRQKTSLSGLSRYSTPPIIPIQNRTYDNIKAQFEAMDFFMTQIENTCGISMVSTGKTPDPDVAKFNMQVAIQGTNDIINNIARAQTDLQEDISVNICYRIRSYCRVNENVRKSYESVIGKHRMKAVMMAEKNHVEYGISIEASDITEEKRNIMAMIQSAITPTGSGDQAKLSPSEAIIILDMIHQRQNLRRIGLILGHWTRKKEKELHKKQMELINAQGDQMNKVKLTEQQMKEQDDIAVRRQQYEKFLYDYMIKHGKAPDMNQMQQESNQQKFQL